MGKLTAKGAFGGTLPLRFGTVSLTEMDGGTVTWLAPLKGTEHSVSKALKNQIGAGLPGAGASTGADGKRVVWAGPGQVFVIGPELKPIVGAAMVDHSSAWARMALEGAEAAEVLARLVPVDLRDMTFSVRRTARTQLGHMACSLLRAGPDRFEIMVFRSMATSAVHELARAMEMVATRAALDA